MGNSVESLGVEVFSSCTKLKHIKLSDSLTSIPSYLFRYCS